MPRNVYFSLQRYEKDLRQARGMCINYLGVGYERENIGGVTGKVVGTGSLQFAFRAEAPSASNDRQACIAGCLYVHQGVTYIYN